LPGAAKDGVRATSARHRFLLTVRTVCLPLRSLAHTSSSDGVEGDRRAVRRREIGGQVHCAAFGGSLDGRVYAGAG
jgi:hypothetical protein